MNKNNKAIALVALTEIRNIIKALISSMGGFKEGDIGHQSLENILERVGKIQSCVEQKDIQTDKMFIHFHSEEFEAVLATLVSRKNYLKGLLKSSPLSPLNKECLQLEKETVQGILKKMKLDERYKEIKTRAKEAGVVYP